MASHIALDSDLKQSFSIKAPVLPSGGDLIDKLLLGEYTLNNNAKYITVTDSMSQGNNY